MRTVLVVAALAALAAPATGQAQVSFGLRAGYGIPSGDAGNLAGFGSFKQRDLFSSTLPLQLDASWRLGPSLSAGVYLGYGIGSAGRLLHDLVCASAASCSGLRDLHVGARADWTFRPVGGVLPWVGLAGGLESAHFKAAGATFSTGQPPPAPATVTGDMDGTFRGWEAALEGGVDWPVTPSLLAGPFVQVLVGQYRVQDLSYAFPVPGNGSMPDPRPHQFLTFGLRARYDL